MLDITRRDLIRTGIVGVGAATITPTFADISKSSEHHFHHDHILGTSLDGWIVASSDSAASLAESETLAEIERLRKVFSIHDPESELSRLNRSKGAFVASADLCNVLREYQRWQELTNGACNAQVGALTRAWELAAERNELPDAPALARIVMRIASPGFTLDGNTVTRTTDQPLNLNSIAKGYILTRTAEVVKSITGVSAGLIDLGGDLCAFGDVDWNIAVQNPQEPADNATPLTIIKLRDASVATSGNYMRHYMVQGVKHSHIIDPRNGTPADTMAGATVIAADSTTANTLATAMCVLGMHDGLKLISELEGSEALLVNTHGNVARSDGFVRFELPRLPLPIPTKPIADDKAWPADFEVKVNLELPTITGGKYRRPYVAVWIEDSTGKSVRSVQVWGSNRRWLATLSAWWKIGNGNDALVKSVTKATRSPGKYEVVWDGKDDAGKALPQGTYTVKVEVHREHGRDTIQTGKLECTDKAASVKMAKNDEAGETTVTYGKKAKK